MTKPEPVLLHMKLPRDVVRLVDLWAAERDLYRNHAVVELIKRGLRVNDSET